MNEFNPYAAPEADVIPRGSTVFIDLSSENIWRDGKILVVRKSAALPDRCVKCDAPAEGFRVKRNLSWHPPAYFLLVIVSWLIYLIVALIIRKTAKVEIPVCVAHRRRRRNGMLAGWVVVLAGIAIVGGGAVMMSTPTDLPGWLIGGGVLISMVGLVVVAIVSQVVTARKIDNEYVWLNNAGEPFLNQFPDWLGGR